MARAKKKIEATDAAGATSEIAAAEIAEPNLDGLLAKHPIKELTDDDWKEAIARMRAERAAWETKQAKKGKEE